MLLVNLIVYFFLIILGIRLFWMLFGRVLAKWALQKLVRRMEDDFARRQNSYNTATSNEQEIHLGRDMKVKVPPKPEKKTAPGFAGMAEDVDFEELPSI